VILATGRLRQEDLQFQDSLGYGVRPCVKKSQGRNNSDIPQMPGFTKYIQWNGPQ
jgi:hypothetical protein